MLEVNGDQLAAALDALGVRPGDNLLVHSAVQFLGRPVGGVGLYLEGLRDALGAGGTLAVPTFNFGFARGEPYDPQTTPSQGMGAFSEYVRRQPGTLRSPHPMQSLAAAGPYAADICGCDTASAFDPGSSFERLLELDFKLLLLGAGVQAVSMIHYSEQRAEVPYRYWKDFSGEVKTAAGWARRTYRMFVRSRTVDPQLDLHPVQEILQAEGLWRSEGLNYGALVLCRLADFTAAADRLLARDPWALVSNREQARARYNPSLLKDAGPEEV